MIKIDFQISSVDHIIVAIVIILVMDKSDTVFNIIKGEYFNYVSALSIERNDLVIASGVIKKLYNFVKHISESQFTNYYDYIEQQTNSSCSYSTFVQSIASNVPFDKFVTVLCIHAVCKQYIEKNSSSKEKIKIMIGHVYEYLNDSSFVNSVSHDQKFLNFIESCEKEQTIKNENKSKVVTFSVGALLIGGFTIAYFLHK